MSDDANVVVLGHHESIRLDAGNGCCLVITRGVLGSFLLEGESAPGYRAIPVKLGNNVERLGQSRRKR